MLVLQHTNLKNYNIFKVHHWWAFSFYQSSTIGLVVRPPIQKIPNLRYREVWVFFLFTQLTLSRSLGIFSFYPTYAIAKFRYFFFLPNLRYREGWVFFLYF